jgi:hypothetical protein
MQLAMIVSAVVFGVIIVLAAIGYAIDRGSNRLER